MLALINSDWFIAEKIYNFLLGVSRPISQVRVSPSVKTEPASRPIGEDDLAAELVKVVDEVVVVVVAVALRKL